MISTLQHTHYYRSSDVRTRIVEFLGGKARKQTCCYLRAISRRIALFSFTALTIPISSMVAQSPPESVAQLPSESTAIRGIVVPVPREIFDTLDKFADSNWRAVQRRELTRQRTPRAQAETALLLGVVIAEGFIAVEAKDTGEVKNVGRDVLKLSRGLGIEKAALRRSRSIVEYAEKGDWAGVRKEWDGVLPDVQEGMNELQSEQLAQLVSLGGWLRGAEALTVLVLQNYSDQKANLLWQPALLDYFDKRLEQMTGDVRENPAVVKMRDGMRRVRPLIASEKSQISQMTVKEMAVIFRECLRSLTH